MTDIFRGMVLGSFAGDSLALAAHWIYDSNQIVEKLGVVDTLAAPAAGSYHPTKTKGDFTHYGDQTLLLLQSIIADKDFFADRFATRWQNFMTNYHGYRDHASKDTMRNMESGDTTGQCGSSSQELGGTARIAPLLFFYRSDLELLRRKVAEQTAATHNSRVSLAAADFLCRITWDVLHGLTPTAAVQKAMTAGIGNQTLENRVDQILKNTSTNTTEVIQRFGQECNAAAALPGVVHLITTYENDLRRALIANVMAGGDSAARGMATGMILGARSGTSGIPRQWLTDMNKIEEIETLLQTLS